MSRIRFLITMLVLAIVIAGCGTKQTPDTKAPSQPTVGVFDMNKVIKAHPKYTQLLALQAQARTIAAEAEAKQSLVQSKSMQNVQTAAALQKKSQTDMDELNKSFEQEFKKKISAKQDELNARLADKENTARNALAEEMKAYSAQLDKEYQSQIFNLQLKMKTVQLTKEETASLQTELETLQNERAGKMSVKEQQLVAQMQAKLAPEKASAQSELTEYSKQVNADIGKQIAAKQAEIAARDKVQPFSLSEETTQVNHDASQQLTLKQQEIQAMQDDIINDIKDKAGKVAIAQNLEAILTNISVNVSGADVTDAIIAECKK